MDTIDAYRDRLVEAVRSLSATDVPVVDAVGLVLAEAVTARRRLPGFDNSAMDGYALRFADVRVGEPLPVADVVPAGDTRDVTVPEGAAVRIMTGARVPADVDTIVPVELTDGGHEQVVVRDQFEKGRHIRRAGEDVQPGDEVLPAGSRITAAQVPVLVSCGVRTVHVVPRPRVAVISTGDELRAPGAGLLPGQIVDSNGPMLAALVRQAGFDVVAQVRCGDDGDALLDTIASVRGEADAIITSGGVSAGEFEPLKDAFGGSHSVTFTKVAVQPGKPQGFGFVGDDLPIFALPGNPVSALVSFVMFAAPALRAMAGRKALPQPRTARVADGWTTSPGRAQVARVRYTHDGRIELSGGHGSHLMGGLAAALALAVVPQEQDVVAPDDELQIIDLAGDFA